MSSADNDIVTEVQIMCCASCGKSELDDVKLMECADCKSVRYCSDECQKDHRPEHEVKCKERATELRDVILFKQPESRHHGDCPICCVPLPIDDGKRSLYLCCGKIICGGCSHADIARQRRENIQVQTCPFCRYPLPKSKEQTDKNLMKRVAANDPTALAEMAMRHYDREEYDKAIDYYTRASELGAADAHYNLSILYHEGKGVEKDETKRIYHLEEAAIAGHPEARFNLACCEEDKDRTDRAVKHFIIAANLGLDEAIKLLKAAYKGGIISNEEFAAALRAHHAAVNAMKSPQREAAEKADAAGEIIWA